MIKKIIIFIKNLFKLKSVHFIGIFDRGYDDNKIFDYMTKHNHKFVVRLDDIRTLLFKGKKRSVEEVAKSRKGKIKMKEKHLFPRNKKNYQMYQMMMKKIQIII